MLPGIPYGSTPVTSESVDSSTATSSPSFVFAPDGVQGDFDSEESHALSDWAAQAVLRKEVDAHAWYELRHRQWC